LIHVVIPSLKRTRLCGFSPLLNFLPILSLNVFKLIMLCFPCSVDDVESHKRWVADIEETQHTKLTYPIIGDPKGEIAEVYGSSDRISPPIEESQQTLLRQNAFFQLPIIVRVNLT
jgi:peroxiredoxin